MKIIPDSLKHRARVFLHSGRNVECPICNKSFRDWYPIGLDLEVLKKYRVSGAGYRKAGCWNCDSMDRSRLLYLYFTRVAPVPEDAISVLHIAPNYHVSTLFMNRPLITYIRGDKFTKGYIYPDGVQNLDILELDFDDNSFDLVICNHVLEHIPDDTRAMRELFRVLKPGGKAILQVPFSKLLEQTLQDPSITTDEAREKAFGQFDHVRIYGMDYTDRLEGAGFRVESLNLCEHYPEFRRYGINPDEDIFVARKA